MIIRARIPDVTFVAAVFSVAIVQIHYWQIAWRFGGTRRAEFLFRDLAESLIRAAKPANWPMDTVDYRYVDALSDVMAISAFVLPALAVLLYGRTRFPRLTSVILRIGVMFYLAWLLVLSPVYVEWK